MKKIILAFDSTEFSAGAFDFACQLNKLQPILLTAVFMPQISYASLWSYSTAMVGPVLVPLMEQEEADVVEKNISRFEDWCKGQNINYRVHRDFNGFALPELKKETRFADLLILGSEKFYHNIVGEEALDYLTDALKETECPVVVVPEKYTFPTSNVFAYDGSASALYAIKQFTYLFPELCTNETTILYLNKEEDTPMPQQDILKELIEQHFKKTQYLKLNINPRKQFSNWINEKSGTLLISGSFGRSAISQLFKKSFLLDVVYDHKLPVFIAHK